MLAEFADLLWSWWFLILVLCALVGGFVGLFPWIVAWRRCWVLGYLVWVGFVFLWLFSDMVACGLLLMSGVLAVWVRFG